MEVGRTLAFRGRLAAQYGVARSTVIAALRRMGDLIEIVPEWGRLGNDTIGADRPRPGSILSGSPSMLSPYNRSLTRDRPSAASACRHAVSAVPGVRLESRVATRGSARCVGAVDLSHELNTGLHTWIFT